MKVLMDFFRSTRNKELKLHPTVVFSHTKRINVLDPAFGTHILQKMRYNSLECFANIIRCIMIKRLKFELIIVFDLLNKPNGLDHDLSPQNWKKYEKLGLPVESSKTQLIIIHGTSTVYLFLWNFLSSTRSYRLIF